MRREGERHGKRIGRTICGRCVPRVALLCRVNEKASLPLNAHTAHLADVCVLFYRHIHVLQKRKEAVTKNSKRILCAGRCISSDTNANSAVRVEAVCMATGQAAGCAAVISAKRGIEL